MQHSEEQLSEHDGTVPEFGQMDSKTDNDAQVD
jgi:hypothetical protein